jgi:RNA polymerase sigma-70 factor (ECF subfamily)
MEVPANKSPDGLDPTAWVERHGDLLYRYAYSRLRNAESAEEVVQETFVSGLRYAAQYTGKGSEGAWLLGILKRKIVDFVRQTARVGQQIESQDNADIAEILYDKNGAWRAEFRRDDYRPLDSLEREDFWRVLRECLKGLPARQADAFSLRTLEQLETEEISKVLEVTSSTVWVLLHRARLRLATCMRSRL